MNLPKPVSIILGILCFLAPALILGVTNLGEKAPVLNFIVAPIFGGLAAFFWSGAAVSDIGQSGAKNTTKWIVWGVIIGVVYALILTFGV